MALLQAVQRLGGSVAAAIVDHDHFKIRHPLAQHFERPVH